MIETKICKVTEKSCNLDNVVLAHSQIHWMFQERSIIVQNSDNQTNPIPEAKGNTLMECVFVFEPSKLVINFK